MRQLELFKEKPQLNWLIAVFLFILNFLWFQKYHFHTFMGDDLSAYDYFRNYQGTVWHYSFAEVVANKYRPVYNLIQYIFFHFYQLNYELYFYTNIIINFISIMFFFEITKIVSNRNIFLSVIMTILMITCRFSYYNITQVFGLMEALGLFFLLCIIWSLLNYLHFRKAKNFYLAVLFEALIIFTHERYIVLTPVFIIFVIIMFDTKKWVGKIRLIIIASLPLILNFTIKKYLLHSQFFEGTGGTHISINPLQIMEFFVAGILNMTGVNIGAEYLNGINFFNASILIQIFTYLLVLIQIILFLTFIFQNRNAKDNYKFVLFFILLNFSLLLSASITIRQEYRWLYSPYIVWLLILTFVIAKLKFRKVSIIIPLVILALMVNNDYQYRNFMQRVYFMNALKLADSTYNNIIKKYGENLRDYNVYIQKDDSLNWTFLGATFFNVYTNSQNKINYVDDFSKIDFKNQKNLLFKVNHMSSSIEEVTDKYIMNEVDYNINININSNEWSLPDKIYIQKATDGSQLLYKIVPKIKVKNNKLIMYKKDTKTVIKNYSPDVINDRTINLLKSNEFGIYDIDNNRDFIWISVPPNESIDNITLTYSQ
jgi:hypothetical protein